MPAVVAHELVPEKFANEAPAERPVSTVMVWPDDTRTPHLATSGQVLTTFDLCLTDARDDFTHQQSGGIDGSGAAWRVRPPSSGAALCGEATTTFRSSRIVMSPLVSASSCVAAMAPDVAAASLVP
jgi:hypothetical protein